MRDEAERLLIAMVKWQSEDVRGARKEIGLTSDDPFDSTWKERARAYLVSRGLMEAGT